MLKEKSPQVLKRTVELKLKFRTLVSGSAKDGVGEVQPEPPAGDGLTDGKTSWPAVLLWKSDKIVRWKSPETSRLGTYLIRLFCVR